MELINKKEFAKTALNEEPETFVLHVVALEALPRSAGIMMHPWQGAKITALKQDKTPTKVSSKYIGYADVFAFDLAMELPKNIGINKYAIELQDDKQPPYRPIYSLAPVELESLKTYIEPI